jgi:hypothetical protein
MAAAHGTSVGIHTGKGARLQRKTLPHRRKSLPQRTILRDLIGLSLVALDSLTERWLRCASAKAL